MVGAVFALNYTLIDGAGMVLRGLFGVIYCTGNGFVNCVFS